MNVDEQWWAIAQSRAIGRAPVTLTRLGRRLVLWRDGGGVLRAHDAQCPHRGVDLGAGRVVRGELECAYHGFRFDGAGACTAMPCEGSERAAPPRLRLTAHPVREERGWVWLWSGAGTPPDALPWPSRLPRDDRRSCSRTMTWRVPHARTMEAMLDLHHLPFAHRRWIRGVGARLEPFSVRSSEGAITAQGFLRHEHARSGTGLRVALEARPPGVLWLGFNDWLEGVVACTPIDAQHTFIVARFYAHLPIVGRLVAWLGVTTELALVQPDDEHMQRLTLRAENDLSECALVRADAPLVEWQRLVRPRRG